MRITTVQSQQYSGTSLQRKLVAAIFGGKLFGGSVYAGQCGPCGFHDGKGTAELLQNRPLSVAPFFYVGNDR